MFVNVKNIDYTGIVVDVLADRSGHRFPEIKVNLPEYSGQKKRAAHGDMSRSGGGALRFFKKHSYRGDHKIYYHHVACQAFFFIFFHFFLRICQNFYNLLRLFNIFIVFISLEVSENLKKSTQATHCQGWVS